MRKLGVVLAAVFVLVVAVLAFAALRLNAFLEDNRGFLAQRAGAALGREVRFDEIGVSFRGGFGARVTGLRVSEAPGYGKEPFLEVDAATVRINPWQALRGEYEIREVALQAPRIRIVRTANGHNVETLAGGAGSTPDGDSPGGGSDGGKPLVVSSVTIAGGAIRYVDRTARPVREIALEDVDLVLTGLGGADPVGVEGAARVFGDAGLGDDGVGDDGQDVFVAGTVSSGELVLRIDATEAAIDHGDSIRKPAGLPLVVEARIQRAADGWKVQDSRLRLAEATLPVVGTIRPAPPLQVDLHLGGEAIPLAGWERLVPALEGHTLSGRATPNLTLSGSDTPVLAGRIELAEAGLTSDGFHLAGLHTTVEIEAGSVTLPRSELAWNGAPLTLAARYGMESRSWTVAAGVSGLALAPVLGRFAPEAARALDGVLDADLELRGHGTTWEEIRDVAEGGGRLMVRDGVLRQFNLVDEVLVGLTGIPGLTNLISPRIRSSYPGLLQAADTPFDEFAGTVRVAGGRVSTEDFTLSAREHEVRGEGWVSFAGRVDVTATLTASKPLSDELVRNVHELRPLLDPQERMRVPFLLRGKFPEARPQPDLDYIVAKLGRSALESGIDRLLGKDKADAAAAGDLQATPTPRVEERLLRRGLDALFGR